MASESEDDASDSQCTLFTNPEDTFDRWMEILDGSMKSMSEYIQCRGDCDIDEEPWDRRREREVCIMAMFRRIEKKLKKFTLTGDVEKDSSKLKVLIKHIHAVYGEVHEYFRDFAFAIYPP